jgi:hypothetical protein
MTSTASLLSAGEILKQDSLGRVRTPLGKRQEILAAFDGSGMGAARFAAMVGMNYSTLCTWVQECDHTQWKDSALTGAAAKPEVQWIEAEIACGQWCTHKKVSVELDRGYSEADFSESSSSLSPSPPP